MRELEEETFRGCDSLDKIKLPPSLEKIGRMALYDCRFREIEVPSSVTYIGSGAFGLGHRLEKVVIPNGDAIIDGDIFDGRAWNGLEVYTVPGSRVWNSIEENSVRIQLRDIAELENI